MDPPRQKASYTEKFLGSTLKVVFGAGNPAHEGCKQSRYPLGNKDSQVGIIKEVPELFKGHLCIPESGYSK